SLAINNTAGNGRLLAAERERGLAGSRYTATHGIDTCRCTETCNQKSDRFQPPQRIIQVCWICIHKIIFIISWFSSHNYCFSKSCLISATSSGLYGVPSLRKISWNHSGGSAVYVFVQLSHG